MILAVLALIGQLAVGAMVLPDQADAGPQWRLAATAVICHTDGAPRDHGTPRHHRHHLDSALCPLGTALGIAGVVLLPAPVLPAPAATTTARPAYAPPARAPPSHASCTGFPRGPPILI